MADQSAYPLSWPAGWPRTRASERQAGAFDGTFDRVRRELLAEIDRIALGPKARTHTLSRVIVSTNLPLRRDGQPYAETRRLDDPGVAVYFERRGKPVCFACDKFDAVWKNMRAVQKTIEALRGIERWGSSQLLDRAFAGFTALPERAKTESCWAVLGVPAGATRTAIDQAYRDLARAWHPDAGGSHESMTKLNRARDEALASAGGPPR